MIADALTFEFPDALVMRGPDDHFILIDAFENQQHTIDRIMAVNYRIQKEAEGKTTGIKAGACIFEDQMKAVEALDRARNTIKLKGTDLNKVCYFYDHEAEEQYWNQRYIVENFEKALKNQWIKIYYQAIERLETGKISAGEALARWVDPIRGIISPGEFIPVLEKHHLLYKLDLYMAEQVCKEMSFMTKHGFLVIPVTVNFTAQDFDHVDIPSELSRLYDRYCPDLPKDKRYIVVEITEQDMAQAPDRFYKQLQRLRELGFRIWLDDFGSGYSSLNMFSRFDIDLIKFDMDLLRNLDDHNGANRRIMKAMTDVAKELKIHVLSEGMETESQRAFLQEIGSELAQGYLFHKPEPLEAILFRINAGQKPRPCETKEERDMMIEKWLE
jgi:EAL domain-containing protein (putative c-di-GMP-specific phosphodiesterase class I)